MLVLEQVERSGYTTWLSLANAEIYFMNWLCEITAKYSERNASTYICDFGVCALDIGIIFKYK